VHYNILKDKVANVEEASKFSVENVSLYPNPFGMHKPYVVLSPHVLVHILGKFLYPL
jgi:hypothetical protein